MPTFYLNTTVRYSEGARALEDFLDDNVNELSPSLFEALDDVAGEIDTFCLNRETEINELWSEKEDLENRIAELENELEALKNGDN